MKKVILLCLTFFAGVAVAQNNPSVKANVLNCQTVVTGTIDLSPEVSGVIALSPVIENNQILRWTISLTDKAGKPSNLKFLVPESSVKPGRYEMLASDNLTSMGNAQMFFSGNKRTLIMNFLNGTALICSSNI